MVLHMRFFCGFEKRTYCEAYWDDLKNERYKNRCFRGKQQERLFVSICFAAAYPYLVKLEGKDTLTAQQRKEIFHSVHSLGSSITTTL